MVWITTKNDNHKNSISLHWGVASNQIFLEHVPLDKDCENCGKIQLDKKTKNNN